MSRGASLILLSLGWACGPDFAPMASEEGATDDWGDESSDDGALGTSGDDDSADESSSGGPPPDCVNIDRAPDETCYVEHLIDMRTEIAALSDQTGDGRLDLLLAQGFVCCADGIDEEAPTGLWLFPGNEEGSFDEPQLLFEAGDHFDWMLPLGPGPDGTPRMLTRRRVDVGFLVESVYGVLAGETFINGEPDLPYFDDTDVSAADLDGDGVLDIAGVHYSTYFAMSGSGGSFEVTDHGMAQADSMAVFSGDHDGDEVDDMLYVAADGNSFTGHWSDTLPGPAPSSIPSVEEWTDVGIYLHRDSLRLRDIDGDGRLDLWAIDRRQAPGSLDRLQRRLVIIPGTSGGFASQVETVFDTNLRAFEPMTAAQDGPLRAVVQPEDTPGELWLMTLSDELRFSVGARLQLTHPTPGNSTTVAVRVGDINGDGHSDFVTRVASAPHHTTVAVLLSHAE